MEILSEKKRRGRKAKTEENLQINLESNQNAYLDNNVNIDKIPKKRGRKPKGGKVVLCVENTNNYEENIPNIILHLKCNKEELDLKYSNNSIDSFQFTSNKFYDFNCLEFSNLKNTQVQSIDTFDTSISNENKLIWQKLEKLSNSLHLENSCDKKSSCFFCTCEFDNMPIYIPKYQLKNTYHVYGCFCSPECACAFLMNDKTIDTTTRFERYYLLNYIY